VSEVPADSITMNDLCDSGQWPLGWACHESTTRVASFNATARRITHAPKVPKAPACVTVTGIYESELIYNEHEARAGATNG
jgi:hypothetical protein